jgi:hypothetical protein
VSQGLPGGPGGARRRDRRVEAPAVLALEHELLGLAVAFGLPAHAGQRLALDLVLGHPEVRPGRPDDLLTRPADEIAHRVVDLRHPIAVDMAEALVHRGEHRHQEVALAAHLRLDGAVARDVLPLADPGDRGARVVAQAGHVGDRPDDRPVELDEALLELDAVQLAAQDLPHRLAVALAVVGVGDVDVARAGELLAGPAEQRAQRVVDAQVAALRVEDRHADRRVVEGGVEVRDEVLGGALVVGRHLQQAERRAVDLLRAQRPQPQRGAVWLDDLDDLADRAAQQLVARAPQQLEGEVVGVDDEPPVIEDERGRGKRG